jgi:hypothetical protein
MALVEVALHVGKGDVVRVHWADVDGVHVGLEVSGYTRRQPDPGKAAVVGAEDTALRADRTLEAPRADRGGGSVDPLGLAAAHLDVILIPLEVIETHS